MRAGLVSIALLCFTSGAVCAEDDAPWTLRGDDAGLALASEMMEALGGRDAWARNSVLMVWERGSPKDEENPVIFEAWRDFKNPKQLYAYHQPGPPRWILYNPGGVSAGARDGEASNPSAEAVESFLSGFPRSSYTLYYRIATGDAALRARATGERSFELTSTADPEFHAIYELDASGGPARVLYGLRGEEVEYVYGPVKQFENVALPAWGFHINGRWRFEYLHARLFEIAPEGVFEPR